MDEIKNYPSYLDYPKPYKMKTNAEHIRALSDENLANFFNWLFMAHRKWWQNLL